MLILLCYYLPLLVIYIPPIQCHVLLVDYCYTVRQSIRFCYKSLEATSQAVIITMQLCFCFDSVATVVHITLLNPLDFLFIVPVNTNTELGLLIRNS